MQEKRKHSPSPIGKRPPSKNPGAPLVNQYVSAVQGQMRSVEQLEMVQEQERIFLSPIDKPGVLSRSIGHIFRLWRRLVTTADGFDLMMKRP
jgi:hypothetical protein